MKNNTSIKLSPYRIKMATLIACLGVICTAVIATTVAFIITNTLPIKNVFVPSNVACEIIENFDGNVKTDVEIKNTGDTTAYIRAAIVVTWMSEDKTKVTASVPIEGTHYTLEFAQGTNWLAGGDGYWYFTNAVESNHSTETLISRCAPVTDSVAPEGFYLSVEIVASAIQSAPATTAEAEWGVVITEGVITAAPSAA